MKSLLMSLVVSSACLVAANASAGVFVHAGPVHVAVGRPIGHVYAVHRPVVVRPIVPARVSVSVSPYTVITPAERAEIRSEVRDARNRAIRDAIDD